MAKYKVAGMSVAAMLMVTLAITTLFGIAIVTQVGDNQKTNTLYSDDQITLDNGTAVALTNDEIVSSATFTLINATNSSDVVDSTNYTVSYEDGYVTLGATVTRWDNVAVNASYTYQADSSVTTTATLFVVGLTVFATFSALVALVLIGSIILKLVKGEDGM